MDSERQLLQRMQEGDSKAQRELYDRFAPLAMAQAMRYVANRETACDVLQESFVKILTAVSRFQYRGEGSLRGWVLSIVSHVAVDWLRQNRRVQLTAELPDDLPDEEPDVGSVPMEVMQRMIEQLPDGYRTVFCLFVFDRKSHKEIAQTLGIKENTSASQFLRAKRLLANMITNYQRQQQ